MINLLRKKKFFFLWLAQFISIIGDMVLNTALPFFVYKITGSTLATGMAFLIETVPRVVLGPLAGALVDRWDRRKILIVIDLMRAFILLFLFLVKTQDQLWILYIFLFIHACISMFFGPAKNSLTPNLVTTKELLTANSLVQFSGSVSILIGPPLGGALLALVGLHSVVFIDIVSFLLSAFLVFMIKIPATEISSELPEGEKKEESEIETETEQAQANKRDSTKISLKTVWSDMKEGFRIVWEHPIIRQVFIVLGIYSIGQGILGVILIPYVKDVLKADAVQYGWICMAEGIGGLVGSFFLANMGKKLNTGSVLSITPILMGGLLVLMARTEDMIKVFIIITFIGLLFVIWHISVHTLLQLSLKDSVRGRIFGLLASVSSLAVLTGIILTSFFGDSLGAVNMVLIAAGIFATSGIVGSIMIDMHEREGRE